MNLIPKSFFIGLLFFPSFITIGGQKNAFQYDQTLRIDFVLSGNQKQQQATIARYKKVPGYSGGPHQNLPTFDFGSYRLVLLEPHTGDTLFVKGFCTLFEEWRALEQAKENSRVFEQTLEAPWPQTDVRLFIEYRQKDNRFIPLVNEVFSPQKTKAEFTAPPAEGMVQRIHGNDQPSQNADLLILAEGYTAPEADRFFRDSEHITDYLFSLQPYNHLKDHITVRALFIPSSQSGTDIPEKQIWKTTAFNSSFSTFGSERYLESFSTWAIFDYAAGTPHDHIIVLVNSDKYGGGGVYNHFSIVSSSHHLSPNVFVHEIGHGLAGLGDEYFYDDDSDFYDLSYEPWNPNLTTLKNFHTKWEHLIPDTVPVPTPPTPPYQSVTGVFEGGGYAAKGIYRPAMDCRMKTNTADGFCQVCQEAISRVVKFYSGQEKSN
ncbi:M64 family metallopeptidase [Thermophagus sp. OGC60D27]|uniref:M64 family metallopeptidase n=1 Tax=Thermophagus sp. OGC60D27 TaxID=3458415 RepID=UPI0040381015